jgi:DNA-directed RNA polymerase specialized sigma24 family protein
MESRLHEQEPVQCALALLSPQASRLLLCVSAGHSTGELATTLECSDTAVRLRLFRAHRQFRRAYRALDSK